VKVSELIAILQKCPQDIEAFTAYDTFACIGEIEPWDIAVVPEDSLDGRWPSGVYLCAGSAELEWFLTGGKPGDECRRKMPSASYRPEGCYPESDAQ
jgi:hypothetical protein